MIGHDTSIRTGPRIRVLDSHRTTPRGAPPDRRPDRDTCETIERGSERGGPWAAGGVVGKSSFPCVCLYGSFNLSPRVRPLALRYQAAVLFQCFCGRRPPDLDLVGVRGHLHAKARKVRIPVGLPAVELLARIGGARVVQLLVCEAATPAPRSGAGRARAGSSALRRGWRTVEGVRLGVGEAAIAGRQRGRGRRRAGHSGRASLAEQSFVTPK